MPDEKSAIRQRRYLGMLAKGGALLRVTADPTTMLLEFPGIRSLRCAAADIEALHRSGRVLIGERGDCSEVTVTEAGRAALRRDGTSDISDQHRLVRSSRITVDGRTEIVVVNDAESPLAALARLRRPDGAAWLAPAELAAGEKLRGDFERAMLQPRVTSSWDISRVADTGSASGSPDLTGGAIAARARVDAAIEAVGPDLGGALIDICCFLKGLEQVERERLWPRRSAKLMLKTGIALLDRHYHPQPTPRRQSRRIRHWGAGDYRPPLRT